jgi:acyl-CoA synthetase (AMP-forming)/AMP-acid ligase II
MSLIPTHYNLILSVPPEERAGFDVSSVAKLLCSSAPARIEQKRGIMDYFRGVELYEAYGSTEAGGVTLLRPHEQLSHPGSIGRESSGTPRVKILDDQGDEVPAGEIGELYSAGPQLFDRYHEMPDETVASFRGEYFSAGDMARREADGYIYLVDRKHNMIITGGENVFPSEVETLIASHPAVFDVAVIGVSDPKWTEAVTAVVILREGESITAEEIIDFAREHLAHFKCPKRIEFISADEMPRTGTGKILHRVLRERWEGGGVGAGFSPGAPTVVDSRIASRLWMALRRALKHAPTDSIVCPGRVGAICNLQSAICNLEFKTPPTLTEVDPDQTAIGVAESL